MTQRPIKFEAVEVRTDSGICPGMAKTQKGETGIIDARTPGNKGICIQAFAAILPMAFAKMMTEKMEWEKSENDPFDIVCPHGYVTFRISRNREPVL
jgi:uncharacterized repeat protein (TIGR04076 family)